jgi:uncharacterized protein (TIRG00374 family)
MHNGDDCQPSHERLGMKHPLFKLLISCALLGIFLWHTPLTQVWLYLQRLDVISLFAAVAISLVAWWLSGIRLWCLLPEFRAGDLVRATFVALFHSTVLLGQLAGDVIKAYRLGRQDGRTGHAEAATLMDRGLAVFAMFCIGAAAAMSAPRFPAALRMFFVCGTVLLGLAGAAMAAGQSRRLLERVLRKRAGRVAEFLRHFGVALHEFLRTPSRMLSSFLLALGFHALCVAAHVVLGHALNIPLTWNDWAAVYAGASLMMLLPISIAGIGVRDSGYIGMLALFGIPVSAGLSMSFIMLALTIIGAACGGIFELSRTDHGQPPLKHPIQ